MIIAISLAIAAFVFVAVRYIGELWAYGAELNEPSE